MTPSLQEQLDDLGLRVAAIERELGLRRQPATPPAPAPPQPAPEFRWERERSHPPIDLPAFTLPKLELSDLLGARALAIAGGVVTLLGVVFCFVLAVDHGWLGPEGRVGLGGAASVALLLAGIELRRRYGTTHAALAAAGAGIAGAYATLLAATALYHLLPHGGALGVAALIAAAGVAVALRWKAQLVAALGLLGAILAPAAIALQDGVSPVGTGFAALMLAGAVAVAVTQRWRALLAAAVFASLPQIVVLGAQPQYEGRSPVAVLVLVAAFAAIYLAAGVLEQLRLGRRVDGAAAGLIFGGALLAGGGAYRLLGSDAEQGIALLGVAAVYGALVTVFLRRRARDLAAILGVPAFAACAFAFGALLSGHPLVYAWAAEAAGVAWLARRTRETRFQIPAAAYALLAFGHLLWLDAPLTRLVEETAHRAGSIPPVLAVAAAAALLAVQATREDLRRIAGWAAAGLAVYAVSLATLAVSPSFDWGHVALAGVWGAIGLACLAAADRSSLAGLRTAAAILLSGAAGFVVGHAHELADTPAGWSLAAAAAALLPAAVLHDRNRRAPWSRNPLAPVWAVASAGLAAVAAVVLTHGHQGWALLGIAALHGAAAAVTFPRQRDLTAVLTALATLLAAWAVGDLLDGTARVAAWSALAAGTAWLAYRTKERRFLLDAVAFAGVALAATLGRVAPPSHLFALGEPRTGWAAALAVAAAVAAIAAASGIRRVWPLAGTLAVYGLSIAILGLTGRLHGATDASFHTGHTLVSAFWGLLALGLLTAGLIRWRSLRLAGLALFAIALGKLFLFDLSFLSSLTRALSFLAVGAVLLAGGFVYQRLAVSPRPGTSSGGRSVPPARPSW